MRTTEKHPVKEFAEAFRPSDSPFPLERTFTEEEILTEIRAERMQGFIQADVAVPEHRRLE
jgi:hypothetical protein